MIEQEKIDKSDDQQWRPIDAVLNLQYIFGIALAHEDARLREEQGGGRTIFLYQAAAMFDVPSVRQAVSLVYEKFQSVCQRYNSPEDLMLLRWGVMPNNVKALLEYCNFAVEWTNAQKDEDKEI